MPAVELDPFRRPFLGAPTVLAADAAPRRPRRTADGHPIGSAVRPSAAVQAHYDARLRRLVDEMHNSIAYWLAAAWKREDDRIAALAADAEYIRSEDGSGPLLRATAVTITGPGVRLPPLGAPSDSSSLDIEIPVAAGLGGGEEAPASVEPPPRNLGLATDARPSAALAVVIRKLRRHWLRRFDDASTALARYFATAIWRRSDAELKKILRRANMTVEFKVSQTVRDALAAIVHENVSLIRSIPEQYLTQVEGSVMRSVVAGRDLASLTADLQHQHGVTRRRAELISLDQNNKISGAIQRLQYLDLGIERAIWRHSHAGKVPRPTHVANDGKEYDVRTGWYDPHEQQYIRTGELIGCRCFSQPILPR
jgi:hypothetical protein